MTSGKSTAYGHTDRQFYEVKYLVLGCSAASPTEKWDTALEYSQCLNDNCQEDRVWEVTLNE